MTSPPLSPERLAELLDDAVRHVTARGDALDRLRRGVRRRRRVHRAGAVLLAVAVLAGGSSTALALTSGRGPASAYQAAASTAHRSAARPAPTSTTAYDAEPSAVALAPAPSVSSAAAGAAGANGAAAPSVGQPARWDIDGDGRPDTATIVPVGNAETTFSFLLVVRLTKLGTQTVPFTATSVKDMPPRGPVIIGAADAAHDGHAELFVQVDAGCCTEFWTIFRLVDGRIRQMSVSGQPVRLEIGGSVMDNGGFSCDGPDLVLYEYSTSSTSTTVDTFLATRATYRWAGAALVLVSHQATTIRGAPADPALAKYTGVSCGDLSPARGEL